MSETSLRSNLLISKVDVGSAENMAGFNIINPDGQMCPVWGGQDLSGRQVCEYSFNTKRAGCNSALDRITVENFLRPKYTDFVTLSAAGIGGYTGKGAVKESYDNLITEETEMSAADRKKAASRTGQFGLISAEAINPKREKQDMLAFRGQLTADMKARQAQKNRVNQNTNIGYKSQQPFNLGPNYPQYLINPVTYSVEDNHEYAGNGMRGMNYLPLGSIGMCDGTKPCKF